MEIVMFITMSLFMVGCTLILVIAALNVKTDKESEKPLDETTDQMSRHSRKTLV